MRVAIRAARAHHKAQGKQRIAACTGQEEGLSERDKERLWQAVGTIIGAWEVVGAGRKGRKGYTKKDK